MKTMTIREAREGLSHPDQMFADSDEVLVVCRGAEGDGLVISRLSMLEWHCAMARRRHAGQITDDYLNLARTEFTRHLAESYFRIVPFDDTLLIAALRVLGS